MELRWDEKDEEFNVIPAYAIKGRVEGIYLVLQVRYREGPKGEDWWGEWQDVGFC